MKLKKFLENSARACEGSFKAGMWWEFLEEYKDHEDTIKQLETENKKLRHGLKGDFDLDEWLEFYTEKSEVQARCKELKGAIVNHCKDACISIAGDEKKIKWFLETNKQD